MDLLKQIGIAAESVEDIVVTHMHYDHAGNIAAFPKARLHLQEKEMAYCTGRCMCHAAMRSPFEARDVAQAVERLHAGQLVFHDGDAEIAPGVSLHLIGGHTAGLQVVRVATERAGWCWPAMPRITGTTCAPAGRFPIVLDGPDAGRPSPHRGTGGRAGAHHSRHDPAVLARFPPVRGADGIVALHRHPRHLRGRSQVATGGGRPFAVPLAHGLGSEL